MTHYTHVRFKMRVISSLIKICPVGAELFHADGQTDVRKLTVPFRNFANVPKKQNNKNCFLKFFIKGCRP